MGPTSKLCGGWTQALDVCDRLVAAGNVAHASRDLGQIRNLLRVFATPEALAQLTEAQRDEVRALQRRLATIGRALAEVAKDVVDADTRRLAG